MAPSQSAKVAPFQTAINNVREAFAGGFVETFPAKLRLSSNLQFVGGRGPFGVTVHVPDGDRQAIDEWDSPAPLSCMLLIVCALYDMTLAIKQADTYQFTVLRVRTQKGAIRISIMIP